MIGGNNIYNENGGDISCNDVTNTFEFPPGGVNSDNDFQGNYPVLLCIPNCHVNLPKFIGDGDCDANKNNYNTEACRFDGGDCDLFNSYPKCNVTYPGWIGDGKCNNSSPYNTEECGFDGGDCSPSAAPSLSPSISEAPSLSPSAAPSLSPSISEAPTAAPTRTLWVNPNDSAFSPLSTNDGTNVEDITLLDDAIAIVNIGFAYNWFGNNLTQLVIQSNGQLFMDTSNDSTSRAVVSIGDYSGSRIAFANGDLDPSAGGAVKVGRKSSGADESFKVSFEGVKWFNTHGEINVQVELFPNGDIIFCYGSGEMITQDYDDDLYDDGEVRPMAAGVEDSDLDKAFPIPDAPFNLDGRTTEWPTNSCWKFQMP
jgi:hypothetical protein